MKPAKSTKISSSARKITGQPNWICLSAR